jgi:hypothetical protein
MARLTLFEYDINTVQRDEGFVELISQTRVASDYEV